MGPLVITFWLTFAVIGIAALWPRSGGGPHLSGARLAGALACFSLVMTAAGSVGILGAVTSVSVLILGTLAAVVGWRRAVRGVRVPRLSGAEWALLATMAVIGAVNFLSCLSPEIRHDAYDYHLNVPNLYTIHGRIHELTWHVFSYMPKYGEMLYALVLPLTNDIATRLIHFGFGVVVLCLTYDLARTGVSRRPALLAVALCATIPLYSYLTTVTYIDLIRATWELAALLILVRWAQAASGSQPADRWKNVLLLGFFSGMMLGTKYVAWLVSWVPIALLALLIGKRRSWPARCVDLTCVTAIALAIVSPWLIYSAAWTGNPVYPLLPSIFGQSAPAAPDAYEFIRGHAPPAESYTPANLPGLVSERLQALSLNGHSLLFVALLAGLLVWVVPSVRRAMLLRSGPLVPLSVFLWVSFLLFLFGTGNHDGRFMITTILLSPVVVILCGPLLAETVLSEVKYDSLRRHAGTVLLLLCLLSWGFHRVGQVQAFEETFRPTLTEAARHRLLDARFPAMPMVRWLERNLEPSDQVYGLGYPCRVPYIAKLKHGYLRAFPDGVPPRLSRDWLDGLHRMGITHIVVQENEAGLDSQAVQDAAKAVHTINGYLCLELNE